MAAVLGAAMMRVGARLAGSKSARSVAGSVLSRGGPDQKSMEKSMKVMSDTLKKISKFVKKTFDLLSRASPALKQQMIIINKSLLLFLRPIGDIMAKFLRPMAIWMIKFAMKWYSLFGGGGGEGNDTKNEKEDAIRTLDEQINAAKGAGDTARVDELQKKRDELQASMNKGEDPSSIGQRYADALQGYFDKISAGFTSFISKMGNELWAKFIPEGFKELLAQLSDLWSQIKYALGSVWEYLKPLLQPLWDLTKAFAGLVTLGGITVLSAAVWVLARAFQGLGVVFDLLKVGVTALIEYVLSPLADFIKGTFLTIWEKVRDAMGVVVDRLQSFWDWIVKIAEKVKNLLRNPFGGSKAVGGYIDKSGIYQLHAGERVIPAGEVSRRETGGRSTTVNVYQSIMATVNNDIDIRTLAKKLADLQETELRRRVPY